MFKGCTKSFGAKKTVVYDFLKNATFRVKSEALNRFYGNFLSKNVYFYGHYSYPQKVMEQNAC